MDWSVFWTAAGAISTTAAVIVALWQTHYSNKKRLKVSFCENMTLLPIDQIATIPKNTYVSIDVANVGNRKVFIKEFGVKRGKKRGVIIPDITPSGTVSLPFELDVEACLSFPLTKERFYCNFDNKALFPPNKRISFYVKDSCGHLHTCKSKKTPKKYLKEAKKGGYYT